MEIAEFNTKSKNIIIKEHDTHVLMLTFIAAKHASHALPVKDLTRLPPTRIERSAPCKNEVPPSVQVQAASQPG